MTGMNQDKIFSIFMTTWIVLGAIGFLLFGVHKNAAFKRKVWPIWILFSGGLFIFFLLLIFPKDYTVLGVAIPASSIITYLNLKTVRFCDSCGATVFSRKLITSMKSCPKCGAPLDEARGEKEP